MMEWVALVLLSLPRDWVYDLLLIFFHFLQNNGIHIYCHDRWPSCAHILEPLADMSGLKNKAQLDWALVIQTSFNMILYLIAANTLHAYPDDGT